MFNIININFKSMEKYYYIFYKIIMVKYKKIFWIKFVDFDFILLYF